MKRICSILFASLVALTPVVAMAQNDVQSIMAHFKNEPTIEATQEAAVNYAGLSSDRLEGMYTRAGASRALPKKLYYEMTYRDQDRNRPQTVTDYKDGQVDEKLWSAKKRTSYKEETDYMQHKVHAEWELSGLIFNSDQLRVVSQMNSATKTRDSLLKNVTKVYYQRRKAQIDMLTNPPSDVASKLNAELKIQELTATLDSMTGGWFSEQIRANKH
jgi:hypothetical protein